MPNNGQVQRKLPLAPLLKVYGEVSHDACRIRSVNSAADYAEAFGTTTRSIVRWKSDGIPLFTADNICIRVGLHPTEVWGMAFYEGVGLIGDSLLDGVA